MQVVYCSLKTTQSNFKFPLIGGSNRQIAEARF